MRTAFLVSTLLFAACASEQQARLATRTYSVDLVSPKGEKMPDQLVFGPGGFESTMCRSYGFQRADYRATCDGSVTTFQATARNAKHGTNDWHGTIHGELIEGTLQATDEHGAATNFTYRGRIDNKPLDGRAFDVVLVSTEDQQQTPDGLLFAAGSFDSTACHAYGFDVAPYTLVGGNGFSAMTVSPENGHMDWQGTIDGDACKGSVVWADAKGSTHRSTFAGKARR